MNIYFFLYIFLITIKSLFIYMLYTLEYNTYEYKGDNIMFYGRKQELNILEKEYLKPNSLCSIYGTRRIGKTQVFKVNAVYYALNCNKFKKMQFSL